MLQVVTGTSYVGGEVMSLPTVTEKHECEQSVRLVEVIEELRSENERLHQAVIFHREDADLLRRAVAKP